MGLFRKHSLVEAQQPKDQEVLQQLDQLQKTTEEIEAEKEAKRLAREEKKFQKEVEKKRKRKERLIAPLLLLITVVCSWLVWTLYHHP